MVGKPAPAVAQGTCVGATHASPGGPSNVDATMRATHASPLQLACVRVNQGVDNRRSINARNVASALILLALDGLVRGV